MIGGTHYFYRPNGEFVPAWIDAAILDMNDYRRCMEGNVKLMESGMLLYLAHPDLFTKFFPCWTKEIEAITRDMFACAEDLQIPLELNANGWRKKDRVYPDGTSRKLYPWLPFWELATEYKIKCVVGSDAHCPADAWGNTSDMVTFAQDLGLPVVNRDLAAFLSE
jgi:histidinol-phosphatase (PHP family)